MSSKGQNKAPPKELRHLLLDHQRWLSSKGRFGKRLDQEDLSFIDLDLSGIDLSYAHLPYAQFQGGSVKGACFVEASLPFAAFYECNVAQADFSHADLQWAAFATNHEQACFADANLHKTAWAREEGAKNAVDYVLTHLTNVPACG